MSTSISSANIDDQKKGIFSQIPNELIFDQILCYFEYYWILRRARLVCKYWNDQHKTIKTNQFKISYKGNIEKISLMMNEHSDELHQVTELSFYETNESNVEMERLFISKLINLQKLTLFAKYCDISIIQEIAKLRNLKKVMREMSQVGKLRELILTSAYCGDVGARYISELESLEMLCLSYNSINGSGLSNFRNLTNITKLFLDNNSIYNEGANYLSSVTSLTYLNLRKNKISGEGLKNYSKLSNLLELHLDHNQIGNIGANYVSRITNITCLNLNNNNLIGEEGLKNFGNLSKLKTLHLENNKIGNGFQYLSNCKQIENLYVSNNNIHGESVIKF